MRTRPPATGDRPTPPGIIDTIGYAFSLLNRRPYLILLPVLVDIYLWLGVRLSVAPLAAVLERWLNGVGTVDQDTIRFIRDLGERYDLLSLIGVSLPTLLGELGQGAVAGAQRGAWVNPLPWWAIPPVGLVLAGLGLAIGIAYLTMLAFLVRDQSLRDRAYARDAAINVLRVYGFFGVAALAFVMILLPAIIFGTLLLLLGINVVGLLGVLAWLAVLWAFFVLFFAEDAIVLSRVGPLRGIYLSYNVVRRNLGATAGFITIYLLIRTGTPLALRLFTQSELGVPFAVVANAYVATGLIVAGLIFYRDRARLLGSPPAADAPRTSS